MNVIIRDFPITGDFDDPYYKAARTWLETHIGPVIEYSTMTMCTHSTAEMTQRYNTFRGGEWVHAQVMDGADYLEGQGWEMAEGFSDRMEVVVRIDDDLLAVQFKLAMP